jgi:hypothetical protein
MGTPDLKGPEGRLNKPEKSPPGETKFWDLTGWFLVFPVTPLPLQPILHLHI